MNIECEMGGCWECDNVEEIIAPSARFEKAYSLRGYKEAYKVYRALKNGILASVWLAATSDAIKKLF